jgi:hypothetical protein
VREHCAEVSNCPVLMDAVYEARRRVTAASPDPSPAASAVASPAPTASAAPSPPDQPPEGDAPPLPEGDPEASARPRKTPTPAATAAPAEKGGAKRREQATQALKDANALIMFKTNAGGEIDASLRRCIQLDDTMADCHYLLGVRYAQADMAEKALFHYRRYVDLAPDTEKADKVREILKKYGKAP